MPRGAATTPLKLEQFLPYRLNVVASIVSQALSRIYADRYGIGVPEWRVLVTLGQFGMMTGKAIGAHSHMHKTKVSRAVAQLEKRKLVTRRANRADLREAFLALTPAGRAMYDDLAPIALDFADRLSNAVDSADRAAFERAVDRLIERSAKLAAEFARSKPTANIPQSARCRRADASSHLCRSPHELPYLRSSAAFRLHAQPQRRDRTDFHPSHQGGRQAAHAGISRGQSATPGALARARQQRSTVQSPAIIEHLDEVIEAGVPAGRSIERAKLRLRRRNRLRHPSAR
jgi:DNA-binding MarR family transcriptional regulator